MKSTALRFSETRFLVLDPWASPCILLTLFYRLKSTVVSPDVTRMFDGGTGRCEASEMSMYFSCLTMHQIQIVVTTRREVYVYLQAERPEGGEVLWVSWGLQVNCYFFKRPAARGGPPLLALQWHSLYNIPWPVPCLIYSTVRKRVVENKGIQWNICAVECSAKSWYDEVHNKHTIMEMDSIAIGFFEGDLLRTTAGHFLSWTCTRGNRMVQYL